MDATSTRTLLLQNPPPPKSRLGARSRCFCCLDTNPPLRGGGREKAPIGSGTEAVARFLGQLYPSLVRPHALHPSSVDPEHPFGTAIGGSLVPPISRSSWFYVEPVYRVIFAAYLGVSPLPDVAGAGEPALAPRLPRASRCAVPPAI